MRYRYDVGIRRRTSAEIKTFDMGISSSGSPFTVDEKQLFFHSVVIGRTGTGKSNLLRNIASSILQTDASNLIVIDFHGQLARKIIDMNTAKELIYMGSGEQSEPNHVKMNLLKGAAESSISLYLIQEIFSGESILSNGTWGPRLQLIFTSILREVMKQNSNATIGEFLQTLLSRELMKALLEKSSGETKMVIGNLISRWPSWVEYSTSSVNKLFPLISDPFLKSIASSSEESVDFISEIQAGKKLVIIDASKTTISGPQGRIISSLILNRLWAEVLKSEPIPKTLIMIDEAQNLNSTILSEILSEGRKFNIFLTVASQFISQYPRDLRGAIMANTGSVYAFNITREDAREVCSVITDRDLLRKTTDSILLGKPHNVTYIDMLNPNGIAVNSFIPKLINQDFDEQRVNAYISQSLEKFGNKNEEIIENVSKGVKEHSFLMVIMERYLLNKGIYVEREKKLNTLRPDLFFFKDNIPFICEIEVSDLNYFSRIVEKICNYCEYELILLVPRGKSQELMTWILDDERMQKLTANMQLRISKVSLNREKILIVEERGNSLYARTGRKLVRLSIDKLGRIHTFDHD